MPDLDAYLDRLVVLAAQIGGIDSAGKVYPTTLTGNLPFVFIYEDACTYTELDTDTWRFTRTYVALVYVQAFDPENATEEAAARDAARPLLVSYPAYFLARRRLQYDDSGLNGLVEAHIAQDESIQSASRDGVIYSGIRFQHVLVYDDQITRI